MAQPLLETGEQRLFVARLDMNEPIGMQPRLRDRRHEEIAPRDHPKHLALGPRDDARRKQRGRRPIHCAVAAARHLMKSPQGQPASRKLPVDLGYAEGQRLSRAARRAFETRDTLSQFGDDRAGVSVRHIEKGSSLGLCKGFLRWYVLYLFSIAI